MNIEGYITPIHIKEYVFCPMLFWYKYVCNIVEPVTELMLDGIENYLKDECEWEKRKSLLRDRRLKVDKMLFAYPLVSNKYRLYGVVDTIFWINNRMNILEIKYGRAKKPFKNHLYQVACYALMAEEEFKQPVYKIILYYRPQKIWMERRFTNQLRQYLIKIVERIWKILEGKVIPEPIFKGKCRSCWYERFCGL